MVALLEGRYSETSAGVGVAAGGGIVELFAAPGGDTWSLGVTSAAGVTCIVAVGEDWQPLDPPPPAAPTDGT